LVIDDDAELCQEMAEILIDEGYSVDQASDGALGKEALNNNSYDLVILDYRMPASSGIEVLRFIKEKSLNPKVFVISGRPFIEKLIKDEDLSGVVSCVINKPFCIKNLLNDIKNS